MTKETPTEMKLADTYPIVSSNPLSPSSRSGPTNLWARQRSSFEMIRPKDGHHMLVYRVDGDYVLDDASLDHRHDQVVRATHVSVVDIRRNAPIIVELTIPAKQSQFFTAKVTFGCTVVDPVVVVRHGLNDPGQLLKSYLLSYHNIMQMGLDFGIEQINEVRRAVHDQLTAYHTVNPPLIDGLDIQVASIEVLTPQRMAELDDAQLDLQNEHALHMKKLLTDTQLELERERAKSRRLELSGLNDREREMRQQDHQQYLATEDQAHEQQLTSRAQDGELENQRKRNKFVRDEVQETARVFQGNPDWSLYGAYVEGGMSPADVAKQLRDDRDQKALGAREDRDAERERKRVARAHKGEVEVKKLDHKRERERDKAAAEQVKAIIAAELKRIDGGLNREAAARQRESVVSVISQLANRGHLDMLSIDVESLIRQLSTGDVNLALEAAASDGPDEDRGASLSTDRSDTAIQAAPGSDAGEADDDRSHGDYET
jgi:hypothetical protein